LEDHRGIHSEQAVKGKREAELKEHTITMTREFPLSRDATDAEIQHRMCSDSID
jgi:hypothetical protein